MRVRLSQRLQRPAMRRLDRRVVGLGREQGGTDAEVAVVRVGERERETAPAVAVAAVQGTGL